jgi:hypothetical protein
VRPDDPGIQEQQSLLRALVVPGWYKEENGVYRVTSFAFVSGDEPSCYIDTLQRRTKMVERFPGFPVGRFTAGVARSLGFNITPDPGTDPDGSSEHVVLTASDPARPRGKHQRACRDLALSTQFISFADFQASCPGPAPSAQSTTASG